MADDVVKNAKVLMVGAGGIGCELLKTLVLSGFEDIEMARIDMDTIETSNLNRQFLFRRRHVGMSKAQVAREAVLRFRPNARIVAHHDNVKSPQFGTDFFSRFAVVLNGLDNMDARRHVNGLCLAAGVPLVESGTAGYLGQVSVHIKGTTECFECQPKPTPKTYPVCTIRNTPDKPIHCVVWAKDMLFATLFGPRVASDLEDAPPAGGADEEADEAKESAEEAAERAMFFRRREGEAAAAFMARIYGRAYGADIERLLRITDMWDKPGRVRPTPLPPPGDAFDALLAKAAAADAAAGGGSSSRSACASLGLKDAHTPWSRDQAAAVFLLSGARLVERIAAEGDAPLTFDKDDALAVEFVAAAAALRSANYSIPIQSLFVAKGMAGNIIHAIATTNAIISGLIVIEATKLLRAQHDALKCTWVQQFPNGRNALLVPVAPAPPNPACYVCRRARLHLALDLATWTLGDLVDRVLLPKLKVAHPTVMGCNSILYDAADGLDDDEVAHFDGLRSRLLADLPGGGLTDGSLITVEDDTAGKFECEIKLVQRSAPADAEPFAVDLQGIVPTPVEEAAPAAAEAPPAEPPKAPAAALTTDADGCIVLDDDEVVAAANGKRKRGGEDEEVQRDPKKGKAPMPPAADDDDEIVIL